MNLTKHELLLIENTLIERLKNIKALPSHKVGLDESVEEARFVRQTLDKVEEEIVRHNVVVTWVDELH